MTDFKTNKKQGFTLSEVLVTLGLIGIVALLVMPSIIGIIPNPNKALFRKSYETLNRAIQDMLDDETIYPDNMTFTSNGYSFPRGFNYTTDPTGAAGTKNKFCYYLAQRLNIKGSDTCPSSGSASVTTFGTTYDGVEWSIYPKNPSPTSQFPTSGNFLYTTRIVVDVNGSSKKPNCFSEDTNWNVFKPTSGYTGSCSNPDTFIIGVSYDGRLRTGAITYDITVTTVTDQEELDILSEPLDNSK